MRMIHLWLLLASLGGLLGQSTAVAMVPTPIIAGSIDVSMATMDCMDRVDVPAPEQSPCKKMTLQCMAAMGCAPTAMFDPEAPSIPLHFASRMRTALPLAARLWGRTYGPEPDPPSLLI